MQNHFTTERLILDLVTTEDYAFIRELVNTKGWIEFIGDRNVHSTEDAIVYINRILQTGNIFYWVVRVRESGTPAGIISFIKRQYLENFDIGFAFLPQFAGKGYAYEAARHVLTTVSSEPAYQPVLATTIPENVKSIQLLTKLGFHFDREIEVENEILHVYTNKL